MRWKAIVLDFDGVIVESVGIKDEAFRSLFCDRPHHLAEIMAYHLSHNAMVRFEKFRHITENILAESYTPERERDLSCRFAGLVADRIIACPEVVGAGEFLRTFHSTLPLYIVSASPEDELQRILAARDLTRYFARVYAVPWVKSDAIGDIIKRAEVAPDEVVFVGDAPEDFLAAQQTGIMFVARDSGKAFPDSVPVFADMHQVRRHLLNENGSRR